MYTYIWYNIVILLPEAVPVTLLTISLSISLSFHSFCPARLFVTRYDVLIYCGWPKIHNQRPKTITRRVNTLNVYRLFELPLCVCYMSPIIEDTNATLELWAFATSIRTFVFDFILFHFVLFIQQSVGQRERERER